MIEECLRNEVTVEQPPNALLTKEPVVQKTEKKKQSVKKNTAGTCSRKAASEMTKQYNEYIAPLPPQQPIASLDASNNQQPQQAFGAEDMLSQSM